MKWYGIKGGECLKKITNDLNRVIEEFVASNFEENVRQKIINIFKRYKLEDLNWEQFCVLLNDNKKDGREILKIYEFLYSEKLISDEYSDYIISNIDILRNYSITISINKYYFVGSNPKNIYCFYVGKRGNCYVYNDIGSNYISTILHNYEKYLRENNINMDCTGFINNFKKSLGYFFESIKTEFDFSIETLIKQVEYFYGQSNKKLLTCLRWFYIYVISMQESNNMHFYSIEKGIDKNYFLKNNFFKLFVDGYRVVYLNSIDSVSKFDKWIVADNDVRQKATLENENNYFPIDFTRIKSNDIRYLLKKWCWERQVVLKTINNHSNCLIKYIEFCQELEKKYKNINTSTYDEINRNFSTEYILEFLNYSEGVGLSQVTVNVYKIAIRSFIDFLMESGKEVSQFVDRYLYCPKPKTESVNVIQDSELEKIFITLKNMIEDGSDYDKLIGIIIHIQLNTSLRRSSILSLDTDCIKENIKSGEYSIQSNEVSSLQSKSKTSNGGYIEINPSKYVISLIKYAMKITEKLRFGSNELVGNKIFIKEKRRLNQVGQITEDEVYRKFKEILIDNNIDKSKYTSNNCRNTFMTKVVNYYREQGESFKAVLVTGHNDIKSTLHYVADDVEAYLEAMHKVSIGDIRLLGKIVSEAEVNSNRSRLVYGGCGYCNNEYHKQENISCLICSDFRVTINRENRFRDAIIEIDKEIRDEVIFHEKEHLIAKKQLLVAYLGAIMSFKREIVEDE